MSKYTIIICDNCSLQTQPSQLAINIIRTQLHQDGWFYCKKKDYCPNCGAKLELLSSISQCI